MSNCLKKKKNKNSSKYLSSFPCDHFTPSHTGLSVLPSVPLCLLITHLLVTTPLSPPAALQQILLFIPASSSVPHQWLIKALSPLWIVFKTTLCTGSLRDMSWKTDTAVLKVVAPGTLIKFSCLHPKRICPVAFDSLSRRWMAAPLSILMTSAQSCGRLY